MLIKKSLEEFNQILVPMLLHLAAAVSPHSPALWQENSSRWSAV